MFKNYNFILLSQSPRRREILEKMRINFRVEKNEIEEIYPENLEPCQIVEFLAQIKAKEYRNFKKNEILITADTVVSLNNKILQKPKNSIEAVQMLHSLSENINSVFTGVCIKSYNNIITFSEKTDVYFKKLTNDEIDFYIKNYCPFDKAGSYGIQDWIGLIGIEKIDGCYYNVMGFPSSRFYKEIIKIIE